MRDRDKKASKAPLHESMRLLWRGLQQHGGKCSAFRPCFYGRIQQEKRGQARAGYK